MNSELKDNVQELVDESIRLLLEQVRSKQISDGDLIKILSAASSSRQGTCVNIDLGNLLDTALQLLLERVRSKQISDGDLIKILSAATSSKHGTSINIDLGNLLDTALQLARQEKRDLPEKIT